MTRPKSCVIHDALQTPLPKARPTSPDMKSTSHAFSALLAQYRDTAAGLGHDHPFTIRLWETLLAAAPESFRELLRNKAREMGLLPEPCGYSETAGRMYSLEPVAARLGMTAEEAKATLDRADAARRESGLPADGATADKAQFHPLH